MRTSWHELMGLGLILAISGNTFAEAPSKQSDGARERFSKRALTDWKAYYESIKKEIETHEDHLWAGGYYQGDGLGVNASLYLAPESGFAFIWTGCLGVYDRNHGTVEETDRGTLVLSPRYKNDEQGFRGFPPEVIPVRWGERRYLIAPGQLAEFGGGSFEPRREAHGFFYLRDGDEHLPSDGAPEIPLAYQMHLLAKPVTAKITRVDDATKKVEGKPQTKRVMRISVGIDAGSKQKLTPGMSFELVNPKLCGACSTMRTVRVRENSSEIILEERLTKGQTGTMPQAGWELISKTTPAPKKKDAGSAKKTGTQSPSKGEEKKADQRTGKRQAATQRTAP